MNPKRLNSFNLVHKGLRLMLYDTALAIQQNDFTDISATEKLLQQIERVVAYYEDHAAHENNFILPALKIHNAPLVEEFEKDHEEDHEFGKEVLAALVTWRTGFDDDSRWTAGREIFYAFNNFIAFNLDHMNREETQLNPEFWKYYSDDELRAFNAKIIDSIEPEKLVAQHRWMLRAISAPEALAMLQGIEKVVPLQVFNNYITMAEECLGPVRYQWVKERLGVAGSTKA